MVLALFATICQLTSRSAETWIIMKLKTGSIIFLFKAGKTKSSANGERRESEREKKDHFFFVLYLNACYLMEQARSSSFSTTPKI